MKPMLAATAEVSDIKYPVYASPKLDGIRGVIIDGQLKSRSLKNIPNKFISARFSRKEYNGLDGELIFGSPTAKDVYRVTNSHCSRVEGTPDVKFYVFDKWDIDIPYEPRWCRWKGLEDYLDHDHIITLDTYKVICEEDLLKYETECLEKGYEGLILRAPDGAYKFGRSTLREQGMMKLKRFLEGQDSAE